MKETRIIMGMPITVEVVSLSQQGPVADATALKSVFDYFTAIDERFSTYKETSEISAINRGELPPEQWSEDMKTIFALSEATKTQTDGYFEIKKSDGTYDPSGLVKGWAIWNAAILMQEMGFRDFYVDAGGDVQTNGDNADGNPWSVGIKNPFNQETTVKTIYASGEGIATSGTYIRGKHIYDPKSGQPVSGVLSLTVIGPNIYEADRFATAAFAMGARGIEFIESMDGLEGYMIDEQGIATMTSRFEKYTRLTEN